MNFQQKCSSFYILPTDQILLLGCLYFFRYWAVYVLQLFLIQVVTSRILKLTLSFWSCGFFYMARKSWHKRKYLVNEKSFYRETKTIFRDFQRTFSYQKLSQTLECAFKVRLSPSKKNYLFASMISLQKWSKILFIWS